MSGEDPKEGGQAGGEFVWLAPDLSVARNGRTLFPGCIHEADNFKPDVVAYWIKTCLLYTSPSPRDRTRSRMPSSA